MTMPDPSGFFEQLQDRLGNFHHAVQVAHRGATQRIVQHTLRQLVWLSEITHRTTQDAWTVKLTALQDLLAGLGEAATSLQEDQLTPTALTEQARRFWQASFAEAVADILSRLGEGPEDLDALGRALTLFFEELNRVTGQPGTGGAAS